jgi:hypothetical protein
MVMRKIQVVTMAALLSGITVPGFAQEPDKEQENAKNYKEERQKDLNREMTLEREYDPIVQDAAKINTRPVVRDVNIAKRPIVYSDYAVPVLPDKEMNVLPPGTLMTEVEHGKRDGYLHIAGGMLMNFNGDIGYHLLNTDRDKLGIFFSHRSTNGNVRFSVDSLAKRIAKRNDNTGGLDFRHRFDAATLSIGGNFGYSSFNYYGLPATIYSVTPAAAAGLPAGNSDSTTNQGNRYINVYAGIASGETSSPGYHIGVDYKNFNQKYALSKAYEGMTENNVGLNLGINSPFNDSQCFGVDLKMNMLTYTAPILGDDHSITDSVTFDNRYEVTFRPYYRKESEKLRLLLGLNVALVYQKEAEVFVSPNIAIDVPVANWSLFYLNLGGGIESNTMYELSRLNRYINPAFAPDASKTWADTKIGIRSSASSGLWFDIFAGYKYTEADVFYNPSSYDWIDNGFNNVSMVFQPVSQRIQAGATLKYDYKRVFDFYLKGVCHYYQFKYIDMWKNVYAANGVDESDGMKPYGKPAFTIDAGVNVYPLKPLTVSLHYRMLSGMYAYINKENVKMNAINDANLRASWMFNDVLGVYTQFNNLLFQKQELYYGYPLQPFTVMGGFSVNF